MTKFERISSDAVPSMHINRRKALARTAAFVNELVSMWEQNDDSYLVYSSKQSLPMLRARFKAVNDRYLYDIRCTESRVLVRIMAPANEI